jgi:hypothetical protein
MKKTLLFIAVIYSVFLFTGCATCPKHSMELDGLGNDKSGVVAAADGKVTVYGIGANRADMPFILAQTDAARENNSRQMALPGSKEELKDAVEKFFNSAADKYNNKYPDKKISGDTLDSWKKITVEKAMNNLKIVFDCYCNDNWIATYMATYEINLKDLNMTPKMIDVFISSARSMIKPNSEEAKVLAEQQQAVTTTAESGTASAQESGTGTSGGATYDQSAEPFWAKEYDDTNNINGVVSLKNNELIIYGRAFAMKMGFDSSDKFAKQRAGQCIDSIVDKTTSEYLKSYPSGQAACDALKAASGNISADAAANSSINARWMKETKVIFSTVNMYYSLSIYKFDISLLNMPDEMKDIFISNAKSMLSPYARDFEAIVNQTPVENQ